MSWKHSFAHLVRVIVKYTLLVREVLRSIPGLVKLDTLHQRLAIVATFLRSCVAQMQTHVDVPETRHTHPRNFGSIMNI